MQPPAFAPTARTTPHRHPDRIARDGLTVRDILDQGFVCHLGFVVEGRPAVLPMMYVRLHDTVFVHGSPAGGPFVAGREQGLEVCLAVTLVDGIVLARSIFNHSLNYRSVIVHGVAHAIADLTHKRRVFGALLERVVPGRLRDARALTDRELASTTVLGLGLIEATARMRTGGPKDAPEDQDLPHWAGIVPTALTRGAPTPADELARHIPLPDYLR